MIGKGILSPCGTPHRLKSPEGMASYHVVLRNPIHPGDAARPGTQRDEERLGASSRSSSISFDRLADEGWALQQDTLERQGRLSSMTQAEWQRLVPGSQRPARL
jgi:hypothetical protein